MRERTSPTSEKIFSSFFSLSPTHLLRQSEPLREMKETLRSELLHSVANAPATRVFPVPNEEMEAGEIQGSYRAAFDITWRTVEQ